MKQPQYMVCFSDRKGHGVKLYGPFVSETVAWTFADELPAPVDGTKGVKATSQFTHDEAHLAKVEILLERRHHE